MTTLRLVDTRTAGKGVVLLTYRSDKKEEAKS